MPVPGGFIRLAGKWVDEAFGFAVGWNFFIYGELLVRPCYHIVTQIAHFGTRGCDHSI